MRRPAAIYGAVGGFGCLAYIAAPPGIQRFAYGGFAVAAATAAFLRLRRVPSDTVPWRLLAISFLAFAAADLVYELAVPGFPGPADVAYVVGFVAGIAGAFKWRSPGPGRALERSVDAAIVATSAALLVWVVWLHPVAHTAHAGLTSELLALGYPVLDIVLLTVVINGGGIRGPRRLFAAGVVFFLMGDIYYARAALQETYAIGAFVDLMWLGAYVLWGAAAFALPAAPLDDVPGRTSRSRLLILVSLLVGPVTIVYHSIAYGTVHLQEVALSGVLVGPLVMWRLELSHRRLARAIEERTESLEALRKSTEVADELRRRHRSILDAAGEGIVGIDDRGVGTFVNPAAADMLGCSAEELVGAELHPLVHHSHRDGTPYPAEGCPIRSSARHGIDRHVVDEVFWRPDGSSFPVEYTATPIVEGGRISGTVVCFKDISEKLVLEGRLRHAQKMEALGSLAGGVAHDFNNLLFVIATSAAYLSDALERGAVGRREVEAIKAAAERGSSLVGQLLTFSQKEVSQPVRLDLGAVVKGAEGLLERALSERVELRTESTPGLWDTLLDPVHAEQVVLNLVINARDACSDGGHVVVRTANVTLDGTPSTLVEDLPRGRYVCLQVSDDGAGIPCDVRHRIFEPFFTTKGTAGTGLGLSTIYGIVKDAGGAISVDSTAGVGTTFRVYLPAAAAALDVPFARDDTGFEACSDGTILVVEDEPDVRALVERMLRDDGYEVVTAVDADDATEALRGDARVCLVLTDVVMPGRSGIELAEAIRSDYPGLPVVFMSGYADQLGADLAESAGNVLQKPFDARALRSMVNRVLTARARQPIRKEHR